MGVTFGEENMTRKKRTKDEKDELIDKLLKDYKSTEDVLGEGSLLAELAKRFLERTLWA